MKRGIVRAHGHPLFFLPRLSPTLCRVSIRALEKFDRWMGYLRTLWMQSSITKRSHTLMQVDSGRNVPEKAWVVDDSRDHVFYSARWIAGLTDTFDVFLFWCCILYSSSPSAREEKTAASLNTDIVSWFSWWRCLYVFFQKFLCPSLPARHLVLAVH